MERLTVVIPVRNDHTTVRDSIASLALSLEENEIEADILLVDDGSTDSTWFEIRELAEKKEGVFGIRLTRSFGRETAVFAGLSQVNTPLCLVMDFDCPLHAIKEMMGVMDRSGADVVEGISEKTGNDGFISRFFRNITKAASGVDPARTTDFRLFNRKVLNTLQHFDEGPVSFRGLISWSGFEVFQYVIEEKKDEESGGPEKRPTGQPVKKLARAALDAVLTYTGKPLRITFVFALICFVGAVAEGIHALYRLFSGFEAGLNAAVLVVLAASSFILFSLGIIGVYIARIYDESKRRPRHVILDKTGGMYSKP